MYPAAALHEQKHSQRTDLGPQENLRTSTISTVLALQPHADEIADLRSSLASTSCAASPTFRRLMQARRQIIGLVEVYGAHAASQERDSSSAEDSDDEPEGLWEVVGPPACIPLPACTGFCTPAVSQVASRVYISRCTLWAQVSWDKACV